MNKVYGKTPTGGRQEHDYYPTNSLVIWVSLLLPHLPQLNATMYDYAQQFYICTAHCYAYYRTLTFARGWDRGSCNL